MRQLILLWLIFCLGSTACQPRQKVDLIIYNAKIYTVDSAFSVQEAVAIHQGKFIAVDKLEKVLANYQSDSLVDLGGKPVYPGFYDPHCHFYGLGQGLDQADLVGTQSFGEVVERLQAFQRANPDRPWIIGRGWDQNDWPTKQFPTRDTLDRLFPDKAVFLVRVDGHAALANGRALEIAGLLKGGETTSKLASRLDGGLVEAKNGRATGILVDNAMGLVRRVMPPPSDAQIRQALLKAQAECARFGLTTVGDAGLSQELIELVDKLHREGSLKTRIYAMISLTEPNKPHFFKQGKTKTDRLNVCSFKVYADGALGSRGACLLAPYQDRPAETGFLLLPPEELQRNIEQVAAAGFQVNTHCIGDSANRFVLDVYARILGGKNDRRFRIEHAQVVHPADVPKFGQYSIIPSVQSTHATSDMYWLADRLGPERVKHAYAYRDLLQQNGLLANGSDFPVEAVSPLYGFHAAVARQDAKGWPEGGFQMDNALDRPTALRAMTIWAAYANFEEAERGSIEPGKMADLVVLEDDLLTAPAPRLRELKVLRTYIGGERVY
jgi:predicted amidohydrolase YtcJ